MSKLGGVEPGTQDSAGQNREESGVSTSSASTSSPFTRPISNLVSAITMPRSAASSAPRRYSSIDRSRARLAISAPIRFTASSKPMFMSWSPSSALVEGVNTGSGSWLDSSSPSGIAAPCMVPPVRYSFQAEPVM